MRVVVALGGNALLHRGEPADTTQRHDVTMVARAVAELAAGHQLVHSWQWPQIGLLALQSEAYDEVRPYPLDVLGAETEGMIGYLLDQALQNELPDRQVATLLTQVLVDQDDPAFAAPTRPVGPVYS
jgi:carbamate kinase